MALNIVLIEPEIPNNTGNIGRLALATDSKLHLVGPYGFQIDDTKLKRAGLDYWPHVDFTEYEDTEAFFKAHSDRPMVFLSSHGENRHWDIPFQDELFLVFGKESVGLPKDLIDKHPDRTFKIPLYTTHVRSLNLANAVGVVVYEGLRQMDLST